MALLWQNEIFRLFNWGYQCLGLTSEIHLLHLQLSSPDTLPPHSAAGLGEEKCKCRGARKGSRLFCPLLIGGVRFSQLSEHDALSGMDVVGMMDFFFLSLVCGKQTDAKARLGFLRQEWWREISAGQRFLSGRYSRKTRLLLFLWWLMVGSTRWRGFSDLRAVYWWLWMVKTRIWVWKTGCGSDRAWKLANKCWMHKYGLKFEFLQLIIGILNRLYNNLRVNFKNC